MSTLRFTTGEVQEIRVVTVVVTVMLVLVVTDVVTEVVTGGVIVVVVVEVTTGILRKELQNGVTAASWCILLMTALTTLHTADDADDERLLAERSNGVASVVPASTNESKKCCSIVTEFFASRYYCFDVAISEAGGA